MSVEDGIVQLCRKGMFHTVLCSPGYQLRFAIFIFDFLNVFRCIYNVKKNT